MYQFSRAIYRELSPHVASNTGGRAGVLEACERTMLRLAYDRRYFAKPTKTLFEDVRTHFPLVEQVRVFRICERGVQRATEYLDTLPSEGFGLDGQPLSCSASTRKGKPCQRQPLPGRDYCPSHQHLEEILESVEAA